ncbi:MAG: hypothetical protein AAF367_16675 [Pseudomonadota bacterium]
MSGLSTIRIFGLGVEDVVFFLRALLTRPGDIPGILRREAARRRANLPKSRGADTDGLRVLTDSWQAAVDAGAFTAPAGQGDAVTITTLVDPLRIISDLQIASAVHWDGVTADPAFPPLSLEAARLSLPQSADQPDAAMAARLAYLEAAALPAPVVTALRDLARTPITP